MSFKEFIKQNGVIYFFISALFVLAIIAYSFARGRLGNLPQYDDVSYFFDALNRYYVLMEQGVWQTILNYKNTPPLSPYTTFVALIAYLIFGVKDWAPYVVNGFFVYLVVIMSAWYFQNFRPIKIFVLVLLLTCPLMGMAVHEFRPDIVNGFLTALACTSMIIYFFDQPKIRSYIVFSGILLGCALLTKPSASLFTMALYLSCLVVSWFSAVLNKEKNCGTAVIKQGAYSIFIGLIVATPYYIFAWRIIRDYVYNALVRDKEIWAVSGGWFYHFKYYLYGDGGALMLGMHFWIFLSLIVLMMAFLVRNNKKDRLLVSAMLLITFIAWVPPTLNVVKTQFLGATFYWLLIFTFTISVKKMCDIYYINRIYRSLIILTVAASAVMGVITFKFPPSWGWANDKAVIERNRIVEGITSDIRKIAIEKPNLRVYFPYTGYINRDTLLYLLNKDGIRDVTINSHWPLMSEKIEEVYPKEFQAADMAIMATGDEQSMLINMQFPTAFHMAEINELFARRDDFIFLREITTRRGQKISIYLKKDIYKDVIGNDNSVTVQ